MSKQNEANEESKATKRKKKRVWLAVTIGIPVTIAVIAYSLLSGPSVEEQLAAIEAARAIPDSENAATIYNELLAKDEKIPRSPDFLGEDVDRITMRLPWTSEDYPDLAEWIKSHQPIIDSLLRASAFDKCRFPIADPTNPSNRGTRNRLSTMRGWAHLLGRAANNDIAEGRTDNAIAKYRSVTQLARHLYQQPIYLEYIFGTAVETLGLNGLYRLLIETDLTETQIKVIEQFQPTTRDNWTDISAEIIEVKRLLARKRLLSKKTYHPLARLQAWWSGMSAKSSLKQIPDNHLWIVSRRRALKIIIELRRYKNRHGPWPETLDEIKSSLPEEALIDPLNGGSFTYKLAGETFKLYSKGQNNIDEDGRYISEHVPNTLQVRIKQDDILFWPPRGRQQQSERQSADIEDPNKPAEPTQ